MSKKILRVTCPTGVSSPLIVNIYSTDRDIRQYPRKMSKFLHDDDATAADDRALTIFQCFLRNSRAKINV